MNERWPQSSMHTQTRGLPFRLLYTLTVYPSILSSTLQNASVSATLSVPNPQSNLPQSVHKHNKTLSLDRHITLAYTNTSEAFPRQSLRRRSEPLFHLPPLTLRSLPLRPNCLSSAGTCQEDRVSVAISGPSRYIERIAKPQCCDSLIGPDADLSVRAKGTNKKTRYLIPPSAARLLEAPVSESS